MLLKAFRVCLFLLHAPGNNLMHRPLRHPLPISMMRLNRSSRFCDWCEVNPCLFSNSRMSSIIVFSVSVRRTPTQQPLNCCA